MKHSQQRPLQVAATSEASPRQRMSRTLQNIRFHLSAWIAVALALLLFPLKWFWHHCQWPSRDDQYLSARRRAYIHASFMAGKSPMVILLSVFLLGGCASLTPERINVLAAIAGQAAQLGAQEWLAKHPEHRDAFQAVIDAINIELKAGNVTKAIAMLHSLPVTSLSSKEGEVYWTGEPQATNAVVEVATVGTLVIWDGELAKAVRVTGAAERPIAMAVRNGLRRAVGPTPPALPSGPVRRRGSAAEPVLGIVPEANTPASVTVISNLYLATPLGRTNITRSVLDVQTHAGSVPVVNVRWTQQPGSFYQIQQCQDSTNWFTFASVTNAGNWSMPWPPNVQPGMWRVLRVR